jgi:ssDNA-binding Zn-finger/Zn-ribbon topoisomerase 1
MKPENLKCPDCGGRMVPRKSVFGAFWGCARFPKCRGKRDVNGLSSEDKKSNEDEDDDSGFGNQDR